MMPDLIAPEGFRLVPLYPNGTGMLLAPVTPVYRIEAGQRQSLGSFVETQDDIETAASGLREELAHMKAPLP